MVAAGRANECPPSLAGAGLLALDVCRPVRACRCRGILPCPGGRHPFGSEPGHEQRRGALPSVSVPDRHSGAQNMSPTAASPFLVSQLPSRDIVKVSRHCLPRPWQSRSGGRGCGRHPSYVGRSAFGQFAEALAVEGWDAATTASSARARLSCWHFLNRQLGLQCPTVKYAGFVASFVAMSKQLSIHLLFGKDGNGTG